LLEGITTAAALKVAAIALATAGVLIAATASDKKAVLAYGTFFVLCMLALLTTPLHTPDGLLVGGAVFGGSLVAVSALLMRMHYHARVR